MNIPETWAAWEKQRSEFRAKLWALLGDLPPIFIPQPKITMTLQRDGYRVEKFEFDNGVGDTVYGYTLLPEKLERPAPAVLYQHYHGNKYFLGKDEMFLDRVTIPPLGVELVKQGYVVMGTDAYAFGERRWQGPAGNREDGAATELSLFKKFLWEGRTLWGMMVRDDLLTLNYLTSRDEIDTTRIGTTGMSLGGSRATWLAALDERIRVVIPVGQMTRYRDYAEQGDFSLHGIYYYIPGMLASDLDMEILVALAAPRPQIILIGDSDPLSPVTGIRKINDYATKIYNLYDAADRLDIRLYAGIAHQYIPDMATAMLAGFRQYL